MIIKVKSILYSLIFFSSFSSFAGPFVSGGDPTGNIICNNEDIVDSYYVAIFHNLYDSNEQMSVTLVVPTGESSAVSFQGDCIQNEDTLEKNLQCQVPGLGNYMYWVTLKVNAQNNLIATANRIGDEAPQSLPNCKPE